MHETARGDKQEVDVRAPGSAYRLDVLAKLPGLKKLDGVPVTPEEADAARAHRKRHARHRQGQHGGRRGHRRAGGDDEA